MGRTKAPSFLDRLIGYDGPQPLTDEATAELRAQGVKDADLAATGKPITTRMVREPSVMDRLTGYDGPQPLTPEGEKAFAAMHEAENAPVWIHPIDLGTWPMDETQVTPDWGMDLTDVKAPRQPHVTVRHATADTSDLVKRTSDRLQAMVDPSSQQPTTTADAGQVRPGSMKGFFQNAITGTGTPTDTRKPLVPPEVAAFVAKQTGTELPAPDADALAAAKKAAGLQDTLASLTDQFEIANGKFDAGRSARLHANAQQPVTDEKAKQDQVRAFVEKKLGLERQARQDQRQAEIDALNRKNTESEMATREAQRAQIGKPKPMDPLEEEKTRAEIAKLEAEAKKLGRVGSGEGLGSIKKKLEIQKLQQELGDHDKAQYLEGYQLDPNAKPSSTELSGIRKAQATANTVRQTVNEIEQLYKTYGAKVLPDDVKGKMETLTSDLQLALKGPEAYQLGVLTGPDLSILEGLTGATTGAKATVLDYLGGNNMLAKMQALRGQIGRRFENSARSLGYHRAGEQSAPTGTDASSDMVAMVDPQGRPRMVPRNRVQDAINAGGRLAQ